MHFSAFSRFGHLRFSGKQPVAQTIYESMREALGGDENLGEDLFSGPKCGELYATAMALAGAQRTIDRVNRERIPHTASEMLARHERDYRINVPPGATEEERRAALETAELLAQGCAAHVVQAALSALLGTGLIAVRTPDSTEYVVSPADWDTTGQGVWKKPDVVAKWRQLDVQVDPGLQTIISTDINGGGEFIAGEVVIVDPGIEGIQEKVTVAPWGLGLVVATFVRSHEVGANITTEPWPWAQTSSRHILVVVTSTIARSTAWRKKIATLLGKMLRDVDCWSVVEEYSAGVLGPFYPGEGIPGITIVGTIPTTT